MKNTSTQIKQIFTEKAPLTPSGGDYSPFQGGRGMFGFWAESPTIISVGQRPTQQEIASQARNDGYRRDAMHFVSTTRNDAFIYHFIKSTNKQ